MASDTATSTIEGKRKLFKAFLGPLIAYALLAGLYLGFKQGKWVWFSYHPISMLLGFVTLAGNATLLKKIGGYENTKLHGLFMSAAVGLGCFGWYVIYSNKEMYNKMHLKTLHGKVGVAVLLAYIGLGVVGTIALNPDFGLLKTNKLVRSVHKWSGRAFTAAAWWCCVTGIYYISSI
jgi:hypothetical protein